MVLLYDWGREISPYAAAPVLMAADLGTVRAKEVKSKRFMPVGFADHIVGTALCILRSRSEIAPLDETFHSDCGYQ